MHGIIASERSSVECARARVLSHIAKLLLRIFRITLSLEIARFDWSEQRPLRNAIYIYIYIEKSGIETTR